MTLLVVFAGAPASLLAGLGLGLCAVLVGLYVLREQHRPLVVPFVRLWLRELEKRRSSVPWQRLRRFFSLLLQLLLLALLLFALADPRSDSADSKGRTIVFLVDSSPSMAGPFDQAQSGTRLDEAKRVLARWVQTLGSRDRALLISISARPLVVTPWTSDHDVLSKAIAELSIKHSAADLPRALRLARDVLPRGRRAEVVLVGDGAYPALPKSEIGELDLTFEPVVRADAASMPLENVGVSNFSARRYPDDPRHFEAQLELSSSAPKAAEVEVTLLAADTSFAGRTPIEIKRALVPPAGRLVLPLPGLTGASSGVVAEVRRVDGGSDWLPADNRAQLLLQPLPPLRVLLVGPPNQFVDAALLTEPDVVARRIGSDVQTSDGPFDIVVHDGSGAAEYPASATLYLGPRAEGSPFPVRLGRELRMFGFDSWKKDSAVFTSVDPYDVQILEGHALTPEPADTVLARSGNDPIVVMGERPEGRFLALGFDPKQSDFFLRAAWPLFLHNTLWELAPRISGEDGIAFSPGREWHLRTPGRDPSALVVGPLGEAGTMNRRAAVTEQRTAVFGELSGFYRIEQAGKTAGFFANYFDEAEARLPASRQLVPSEPSAPRDAGPAAGALARPQAFEKETEFLPWLVLLGCALLLSFSEWWSYHRRWTV